MPLISLVINCDSRPESETLTGEPLHGVRSRDFLTEGVRNKVNFFRGHDIQLILYVDIHEPLQEATLAEMQKIVDECGNNSKLVCASHNRTRYRWYDYIYLEALKLADGAIIVHLDQDCNAFRKDSCDIVNASIDLLDTYKYICQPSMLSFEEHQMYYASTRYFICKKETLDIPEIERCFNDAYLHSKYGLIDKQSCCLEQTIGIMAGERNVLYPPRQDSDYVIFNWARYFNGTLAKLNEMSYDKVELYVNQRGIHGANDLIDSL